MMKMDYLYERLHGASVAESGKILEGVIARSDDYTIEDLSTIASLATCAITSHRLTHPLNKLWVSFAENFVTANAEWHESTLATPVMQETVKFHGERDYEQKTSFMKPDNFQTILGLGYVSREFGFAYMTYIGHGVDSGFVAPGLVPRIGTSTIFDASTIE